GGAPNNICEPSENSAGCSQDCSAPCNHNHICDAFEDQTRCDDCITGTGCNDNTICEVGEDPTTCADCTSQASSGHPCSVDGNCSSGEGYACADCSLAPTAPFTTHPCASDGDCSAAENAHCPLDLN